MAAVHILIFGEVAGFKIVPSIATHMKMKNFFHGAMKKNFSANQNSPICMKTTDIKLLPNDKILDWSKLKAFTDDKINVKKKMKCILRWVEKNCGKRRKCWFPAFSPFPTMFSKGFYLRVIKMMCGKELTLYKMAKVCTCSQ